MKMLPSFNSVSLLRAVFLEIDQSLPYIQVYS